MTEQQSLLVATADPLFAALGPAAQPATHWAEVEAVGITSLLIPEDAGGFGGGWDDALLVFRLAGHHGVALPVVEAILAAPHAPAGASGFGSIAVEADGEAKSRFTGRLAGVPWGRDAAWIVASVGERLIVLERAAAISVDRDANVAGEPRDALCFSDAPFITAAPSPHSLLGMAALARVAQIAGALDAALGRSVAYVNERQQFARPLAKFQSVQQALASFANEAAAANCAAMGAFQAAERGPAEFEIAAAKLRANMAVGLGTAIAHQVHGAIGFTQAFGLHPFTRRLWSWRSEYGGDRYWSNLLGGIASSWGQAFWPTMVGLSDPAEP